METERSLPYSQAPATCPYPVPGFQIGLLFIPEMSASFASYIVQSIYIPLMVNNNMR